MKELIDKLVEKGILEKTKAAELSYKVKKTGKREEEVLLENNIVSEASLFALKAEILKVPLKSDLPEEIPAKVLELIPEDSAKYYKMIPFAKEDNTIFIGMVHPEDFQVQEALRFLSRKSGFKYKIFLIPPSVFRKGLKQYRALGKEIGRALEELEIELQGDVSKTPSLQKEELSRIAEEAPITRLVAVVLRHAIEGKASDIHIEPGRDQLRIRFRQDGILRTTFVLPLKVHPATVARIKILSNLRLDESRIPQDGRFSAKIGGRVIDFRVSTFPTNLGEKVVLRVLDPQEGLKSFDDLGLEGRNLEVVKKAVNKPYGLILSTGPTGSGKTTTLYTILNSLNKEGVNIVTLEDPVEYLIEGVNQSQIRPEINYTFASGLRHVLRQDPDIIMVGEIRDEESAALAIHASLTGHIVLSTLHTNNAIGVIPRLIDLKISPFLLPASLSLAIGQRLVRKLCEFCKEPFKPEGDIKELIENQLKALPRWWQDNLTLPKELKIFKAKGCKKCSLSGYSGRIGIFEVLEMTDELAEIILKEPSESAIIKEAQRQGMISMRQDGILKVLDGITSIEEVLRVTQ